MKYNMNKNLGNNNNKFVNLRKYTKRKNPNMTNNNKGLKIKHKEISKLKSNKIRTM